MAHEATVAFLKATFEDWSTCLNEGRLDDFFAYFHADSDTLDEDYPWRMTKDEFIDHIAYHATSNGGQGRGNSSNGFPANAISWWSEPPGTSPVSPLSAASRATPGSAKDSWASP